MRYKKGPASQPAKATGKKNVARVGRYLRGSDLSHTGGGGGDKWEASKVKLGVQMGV